MGVAQQPQRTRKRTRAALAGTLAVVVALVLLLHGLLTPAAQPPRSSAVSGAIAGTATPAPAAPQVGHYAPDVSLLTLANVPVDVSHYRGDVVIINFWYVACEPCRYEMPALEHAYQTQHTRGLVVLGIDIADDAQTISDFTGQLGITYPILRDTGQRAVASYQIAKTPSSIIIDRAGVIRAVVVGPIAVSVLARDVTPLLASH